LTELTFQDAIFTGNAGLLVDGKGIAAAAGRGCVGVSDGEGGTDKVLDEIDFGTGQIFAADRIDHDRRAVLFNHNVVIVRHIVEGEIILKARAAAAGDSNAQPVAGLGFGAQQLGDAPGGALRDCDGCVFHNVHSRTKFVLTIPKPVLHGRYADFVNVFNRFPSEALRPPKASG